VERTGYSDASVLVLYNFLDTQMFHPYTDLEKDAARQRLGFSPDLCVLACIGRLALQKNQFATLYALRQLKDTDKLPQRFRFLFVRRPYASHYAAEVYRLRHALGLEDVCAFLDPLTDMTDLYNALDGVFQPSTVDTNKRGGPLALLRDPYAHLIFLLTIACIFTRYFIDYSFLEQTQSRTTDARELASFLGLFFGVVQAVNLALRLFFSGRILTTYGVKVGIMVLPVSLLAMTVAISLWGTI
jgi:glycosyltransferase involved in cell wall biosynthesis